MPETQKITVLLADEDTLRRDGLASVLRENTGIEVLAGCSDGQTALDQIRDLLPDVAIVDLNLPVLHGIELVRRIRGESLGTKIIILSGTMDDEIVREVVRAGADAYLLKNGPARHLTDAINYVRDGGQYFSPQLHRDGRDRHLLEEPPRVPPDRDSDGSAAWHDEEGRPRQDRRARLRTADPARFRERLREETSRKLRDRDYDIMAEMADGIRPILDRLDEIEDRVVEMETGDEPLPADPRGWLSAQLSDTLTGSRSTQERSIGRVNYRDVEARLPELIEQAVTKRFQSMAGKLQAEIEEQHVRTLETFVKNIQVKLVQRVSVLEQNMQHQADAMLQLREYNQRTEDNLSRLITGVDKLAHELPKRLSAAQQQQDAKSAAPEPPVRSSIREASAREAGQKERHGVKPSGFSKKTLLPIVFWVVVLAGITVAVIYGIHSKDDDSSTAAAPPMGKEIQTANSKAAAAAAKPAAEPPMVAGTDTKTKLDAAKQYMERKEYATAEDIYKQVVQAEPHNVDALTGLASVLYREDKMEESAAVLDRIPKN
jgi:DNA-binding NarL/FixJ family response regulator/predicted negative regulator of RcsB-dependent stress response